VILVPRSSERRDAARLVAGADQVHAEVGPRFRVGRVELHGLAHHGDDLVVAVLPIRELTDNLVETRVLGVLAEHRLSHLFEARLVVREEANGGLHREKLEVVRVDGEALIEERVCARQIHRAQGEARADEERALDLRVDGERLLDLVLGGVEIERLIELHVRHRDVRRGVVWRDLERLLHDFFGVAGVVLLEEEIGAVKERLDAHLAARLFGLVVGVVGVARAPQEVRRASDEREPLGVAGRDGVLVVVGDDRHERVLGVRAAAHVDQELAQEETGPACVGLVSHPFEGELSFARLALPHQRFRPHACGVGGNRRIRFLRGRRGPVRVRVLAGGELHLGEPEERGAALGSLRRFLEILLGLVVVTRVERREPLFELGRFGRGGMREARDDGDDGSDGEPPGSVHDASLKGAGRADKLGRVGPAGGPKAAPSHTTRGKNGLLACP
jgi:hypothetical protein